MSKSSQRKPLQGSERPRAAESTLIGPLAPDTVISVTLILRPRPGSPPLPDFADWQRTPPGSRKHLSVEEYTKTYGSSEGDLKAVEEFVTAHGMRVLESSSGRRNVIAQGTAAQMNEAFGIELKRYESPLPVMPRRTGRPKVEQEMKNVPPVTHVHRGFDGPAHLPEGLSDIVRAVIGLDKRRIGAQAGTGDPSGAAFLAVPTLAQLYNFPPISASDQTIGVLSGGGSYLLSDIKNHYFPSLPAGYQTPPNIVDVDLTYSESGTTSTFSNNPSEISSGNATNGDYELTQDICTSSTVAQGATVNVYFMDDSEAGWVAFLNRLLVPGTETQPSVVTSSWFFGSAGDDVATIGSYSQSGTTANTLSALFNSVRAQGITLFIAAGDWGCDDGQVDGQCHVKYPASDPWVTCVGGTIIGNINNGPPVTFDEWVWSDAHSTTSPFNFGGDSGATAGGVSDNFPVPDYQTATGIAQKSNNDNQVRRGVPDVAGMVALTGFYMNGSLYPNYMGTSCVAPLYCGLIALINSAIGKRTGFLNYIVYPLGNTITRTDVTVGNNDSGDTPTPPTQPAKPYQAGAGWDACTGWGSLDGTKLLNGVVKSLFTQDVQFWVNKNTFGLGEVTDNPNYPDDFWVVLEGFTPNALGITAANPSGNVAPILSGSFYALLGASSFSQSGPPKLEAPSNFYTPQRIMFPYSISFPSTSFFPSNGEAAYVLSATVNIPGSNLQPAETLFELVAGADPYFTNVDPAQDNAFWLSQDLRVFTITPESNNTTPIGTVPFTFQSGSPTQLDPAAAYSYIQQLVAYMNANYSDPSGTDPFDINNSVLPDQGPGALTGDSSVTPASPNPANASAPFYNYNFAIARVRLNGASGSTGEAQNVKVFFRMFGGQTNDTDYIDTAQFISPGDPSITYPSSPSGSPNAPAVPLPGTDASGNINGSSIPFFADPNQLDLQPATAANPNPPYGVNNRNITIPNGQDAVWTYFGSFLNVYDPNNEVGGFQVQHWLAGGTHHCIVAQIAFDGAPIENSNGITESPENSDKLAQRNLQVTPSGNPGFPATHRVPQTFDLRPSPSTILHPAGYLTNLPDELMIDLGNTPVGSVVSVYWPQASAAQVLELASEFYSTHLLSASDSHTIQSKVSGGVTYIPIPTGAGQSFAGLFTVDLPPGVRVGNEFDIIVRRITSRQLDRNTKPVPVDQAQSERRPNWRYVVGTFQIKIPVQKEKVMLPADENLLAILKWRSNLIGSSNRWYPVLQRYISYVSARVKGMGRDPGKIQPSPVGTANQPVGRPGHAPAPAHGASHEFTGKVSGMRYDRFGDFDGFYVRAEDGSEHFFWGSEGEIEKLVYEAWLERFLISVFVDHHRPHCPTSVILRRAPHRRR